MGWKVGILALEGMREEQKLEVVIMVELQEVRVKP